VGVEEKVDEPEESTGPKLGASLIVGAVDPDDRCENCQTTDRLYAYVYFGWNVGPLCSSCYDHFLDRLTIARQGGTIP